ncbi:MAG: hypothetical protein ACYDAY_04600 [Candidatus Dormibacteria bacterium]
MISADIEQVRITPEERCAAIGWTELLALVLMPTAWPLGLGVLWSSRRISAGTRSWVTGVLLVPLAALAVVFDFGTPSIFLGGDPVGFRSVLYLSSVAIWTFTATAATAALAVGLMRRSMGTKEQGRMPAVVLLTAVTAIGALAVAVRPTGRIPLTAGFAGTDPVATEPLWLLLGIVVCLAGWWVRSRRNDPGVNPVGRILQRFSLQVDGVVALVALWVLWPIGLGMVWASRSWSSRVKIAVFALVVTPAFLWSCLRVGVFLPESTPLVGDLRSQLIDVFVSLGPWNVGTNGMVLIYGPGTVLPISGVAVALLALSLVRARGRLHAPLRWASALILVPVGVVTTLAFWFASGGFGEDLIWAPSQIVFVFPGLLTLEVVVVACAVGMVVGRTRPGGGRVGGADGTDVTHRPDASPNL